MDYDDAPKNPGRLIRDGFWFGIGQCLSYFLLILLVTIIWAVVTAVFVSSVTPTLVLPPMPKIEVPHCEPNRSALPAQVPTQRYPKPHDLYIEPASADECLKRTGGVINEMYQKCRNGYTTSVIE